jgi:molybdenum cofactor biosynthesis enzyme MoaA
MEIFGQEVKLRSHYCKYFEGDAKPVDSPYVLLYVKFKGCNANCMFCEYQDDAQKFNGKKYFEIIEELKNKVFIKKIAFSGGEPTLHLKELKSILRKTRNILPYTSIVLNTNGVNLTEVFEDRDLIAVIDNISISRHHYDDKINNEIFQTETISSKDLTKLRKNIRRKGLFHLSCNLIKGYIDNKEEVYNYLEYANSMKIKSVGFISLMPINEFCKANFADFNKLDLLNENFRIIKEWNYEDICKCYNYIYIPKDYKRIIHVYHKNTYHPTDININLSFDGETLRNGFNGKIIY